MDAVAAADSVTVAQPTLGECGGGCVATASKATDFTDGQTMTLRCHGDRTQVGDTPGTCADTSDVCILPNVAGFAICIFTANGTACPAGWPTQHLIFEKSSACFCSCGAAMHDECSVEVTAYGDGACTDALGSVTATSDQPAAACFDVAPGSALGSKKAVVTYTPGTCPASLEKTRVQTVCCMP